MFFHVNNILFSPKLKQIIFFDHLLNGKDVIAVLPTGFGKSIIFQLLHDVIPSKSKSNNNKKKHSDRRLSVKFNHRRPDKLFR